MTIHQPDRGPLYDHSVRFTRVEGKRMVAAMTVQQTTIEASATGSARDRYAIEFASLDPTLSEGDLNGFLRLPDEERRRIIIRVLCGLVAMGEPEEPEDLASPGRHRSLPRLGLEKKHNARAHTRPRGWNTALLPFLGREEAF